MKGIVFNIQRMSTQDGPGIRTTVFLKGCPLTCLWCSNPESQKTGREIVCLKNRCIQCGYCANVCPENIIERGNGFPIVDRVKCIMCLKCVDECCVNSKKAVGDEYTPVELMEEIVKDRAFYATSGGGVTFSGGEPFMQSDFLIETLKRCKEEGIHTAVESCGMADPEKIQQALRYLDLVFLDIKHMDEKEHIRLTGQSNKLILSNVETAAASHDNIIIRIPVIPGMNDSRDNLWKTAAFAAEQSVSMIELLPYHNLGEVKYEQLGRDYNLSKLKTPEQDYMEAAADIVKEAIGTRKIAIHINESL